MMVFIDVFVVFFHFLPSFEGWPIVDSERPRGLLLDLDRVKEG